MRVSFVFSRRCCFLFSMYFFRLIIPIEFWDPIGRSKMRALTRDCSLSLSRTHSGVIATCGKFDKFAPPGCHCIIPCLGTFACSRCVPFFLSLLRLFFRNDSTLSEEYARRRSERSRRIISLSFSTPSSTNRPSERRVNFHENPIVGRFRGNEDAR